MASQPFGSVESISLELLMLDSQNPRFHPPAVRDESQTNLAVRLVEEDDAIVVARSIARHGFYPWEVLVVIQEGETYTVVEGNRRLAALKALTDGDLRDQLPDVAEWNQLAKKAAPVLDGTAPCVIAESRESAQPALGYRHISGIAPWQPYAQARFIAHMIENEKKSETEVAEVTGKTVGWVRDVYRNYRVTAQADVWGYDIEGIADTFSLMDVALGQRGIKTFLGVGTNTVIEAHSSPIPDSHKEMLETVIGLIWGDDERDPVISDSRQIRKLGRIINNPAAMKSLRDGKSLDEASADAVEADYDPVDGVVNKLQDATKATKEANREIRTADDETLLDERIGSAIETFRDEASQLLQASETE